jgi:hypothetical protein
MRLEIELIPSLDIRVVSSYHIGTLSFYPHYWTRLRIGLHTYVPNVYSKCFIYFFQTYVVSVFIWMLHMFHTYVVNVFIWMLRMFAMVFKRC